MYATTDGPVNASTLFPPPAFVAWRRQWREGKPTRWTAVAGGTTERECWERLQDVMSQTPQGTFDSLILPGDAEP